MRRFVDHGARFDFLPPFSKVQWGQPFDIPEAETRRETVRSVTEVLVEKAGLGSDERLRRLATMTHLTEVALWQLPSDRDAQAFAEQVKQVTAESCGEKLTTHCVEHVLAWFDRWYEGRSEG